MGRCRLNIYINMEFCILVNVVKKEGIFMEGFFESVRCEGGVVIS